MHKMLARQTEPTRAGKFQGLGYSEKTTDVQVHLFKKGLAVRGRHRASGVGDV